MSTEPDDILREMQALLNVKMPEDMGYFVVLFPHEIGKKGEFHVIADSQNPAALMDVLFRCMRAVRMAAEGKMEGEVEGEMLRLVPEKELD